MLYVIVDFSSPQLWLYNEGEVTHVGNGHSGNVTKVRVAPNGQHVVTVSADGGILRWKLPLNV